MYHDAVEEEGNTEEDLEEEEKEENAGSKKEVTKYAGVTRRRQTSTGTGYTDDVMKKNDRDKSQARQASTNVSISRRRAEKRLVN